jgi:hypothetical protein
MSTALNPSQMQALQDYSKGKITAIDLRRRFGGATYGDVFRLLAEEGLPLPQAPL